MDPFRVVSRASRGRLSLSRAGHCFLLRVVPCGTIWLFANEAEVVSEAVAPFDQGQI